MISKLRTDIHNRTLDFRALDRIVKSTEFEEAYRLDPDNVWIMFALNSGNVQVVEAWIKKTLKPVLGNMTIRELRAEATQLGIKYVTSKTKDELIVLIVQKHNDRRTESVAG